MHKYKDTRPYLVILSAKNNKRIFHVHIRMYILAITCIHKLLVDFWIDMQTNFKNIVSKLTER